jgi:hypothetical protein
MSGGAEAAAAAAEDGLRSPLLQEESAPRPPPHLFSEFGGLFGTGGAGAGGDGVGGANTSRLFAEYGELRKELVEVLQEVHGEKLLVKACWPFCSYF